VSLKSFFTVGGLL